MLKIFLAFFILVVLVFPKSETLAQEKCIGVCPAGTSTTDNETCFAPGNSRPLLINSLSCNDPNKVPTSTKPADIDSCICNPKPLDPSPKCPKVTKFACSDGRTPPIEGCGVGLGGDIEIPENRTAWSCEEKYPGTYASTQDETCVCRPKEGGCKKDDEKCTSAEGLHCDTGTGKVTSSGSGIMTAIGCIPSEPQRLVEGLLKYGTFAAGGIAFLLMILGALQMITAEGNPEAIKHAQERFYSAIIGLLLIIFAVLLMQVIGVDILGLPGFGPAK